jgi:hypothetical protein
MSDRMQLVVATPCFGGEVSSSYASSIFALFECLIDPATCTYLSEDSAFCTRWTDIGGEIRADIQSSLDHVWPSAFHSDITSQFAPAPHAAADAA